jgi:tetratricopeptide (TPR) repeat protein
MAFSAYTLDLPTDVRLTPSASSLSLGSKRELLTLDDIIQIAFEFSGTSSTALPAYKTRIYTAIDQLNTYLTQVETEPVTSADTSPDVLKGEAVLAFMHKNFLKRYSEIQSKLDIMLDTGQYNCVSSATFYLILARAAGLQVGGVKTTDHAFCIVYTDGHTYDVETTNIYGFDPGKKKEFKDEFGRTTGFSYVPQHFYNSRQTISAMELVVLILQNRISVLTDKHQFAEAVGLSVDAYAFLGDGDAFEKMILAITNLGSWINLNKQFVEGMNLIDRVTEIYGSHDKLVKTKKDLVHNWIVELLNTENYELAQKIIEDKYLTGDIPPSEYQEFLVYICQVNTQAIEKAKGPLAAYTYVQQALEKIGANATLINTKKVYLHNYEVQVHNAMAVAYNAGDYERARAIIEEALGFVPDSEKLQTDLKLVLKALPES